MEEKKNYYALYRQKNAEIHTSEEILQAFDSSFCACFSLVKNRSHSAKTTLFGMIWEINPDALIVQTDLFVEHSEPMAARDQYLVISKNGTKESNSRFARCIETSGVVTTAWYIRSQKRGDIKICYRHIFDSDRPAIVHKVNLLIDGDDLLLTIRRLSLSDRARMKTEGNS